MPTHNSDQMLLECCLGKHFSHFMEKEEEKKAQYVFGQQALSASFAELVQTDLWAV